MMAIACVRFVSLFIYLAICLLISKGSEWTHKRTRVYDCILSDDHNVKAPERSIYITAIEICNI